MYAGVTQSRSDAAVQFGTPAARRIIALTVAIACVIVLSVALALSPAEAGVGTHEQLNLPPCGWIAMMEFPCMTCGMTTAFSHAVRGEFLASLLAQPLGFLLAMATGMTMLVAMHVTMTGSNPSMLLGRLCNRWMLFGVGVIFIGAWLFKIVSYKGLI